MKLVSFEASISLNQCLLKQAQTILGEFLISVPASLSLFIS